MGKYCPDCIKCAFTPKPKESVSLSGAQVIVPRHDYDCVLRGGSELVMTADGEIGVSRPNGFHPITDAGREFHREMGNSPIAAFI